MKKLSFVLVFLFLQIGCQNQQITSANSEIVDLPKQTFSENLVSNSSNENVSSETPNDDTTYPGKTIDEIFPIIAEHSYSEESYREKTYSEKADEFQITFKNFTPKTIAKNGRNIFSFKILRPNEYHSNLIGISHLLGKASKQIYAIATGPGGPCCTNYWITDVSGKNPRNIFRSEDFGSFRDPMEIFDADGDGIYEIMQWDAAFRYFLDKCGACSPEPRAVFKYDKKIGKYLPAKNIQQDFIKEYYLETEKWIPESFEKLKKEDLPELKSEYSDRFLSYVIGLFYLGNERKGWKTFDKYYIGFDDKEKVRAEIKSRLKQSKFFQGLKKSS